jgi:tRNA(Arg) A34 adenosine deaminase TadA
MSFDHEHFMRMSIEEAAKGGAEGNPAVGSVIVREGSIVAVGKNWSRPPMIPRPMPRRWPYVRRGLVKAIQT